MKDAGTDPHRSGSNRDRGVERGARRPRRALSADGRRKSTGSHTGASGRAAIVPFESFSKDIRLITPRANSFDGRHRNSPDSQLGSQQALQQALVAKTLSKTSLASEIEAVKSSTAQLFANICRSPKAEENRELRGRVIIVSATLPFVIVYCEDTCEFEVTPDDSEANLKQLLSPNKRRTTTTVLPKEVLLVGAPVVRRKSDNSVMQLTEELQKSLQEHLDEEGRGCTCVFCGFDKFSSWVIFPLFHYTPPSMEKGLDLFDWEGHVAFAKTFRDAVMAIQTEGDLIWINSYSLMLLPALLRREQPDMTIGFYMNCVFPSSELYRILPQREDILRGILSANVIGFNTFQYVRHFLTACTRVLGIECSSAGIEACEETGGTLSKAITVPLGINLQPYLNLLKQPDTIANIAELAATYKGKKLIVGVDALEEKKGIPHKIMAFHKFLQREPSWATKCVFIQIVDGQGSGHDDSAGGDDDETRPGDEVLLQRIYEMVGEVNSSFGTITHLPVHFLCQESDPAELVALFSMADVFLDTPLRDMISQSAHVFLTCQEENDCGVLILSEFSGSAQSLRAASLCVNPWDTTAFADAIQEALEMEALDRKELYLYGTKYVKSYTSQDWAHNFFSELRQVESECELERRKIPPQLDHDLAVSAMRRASHRFIILGFSGTLLRRHNRLLPKIVPKLNENLKTNLEVLAEDPNTHLIIVTAEPREVVGDAFEGVPCWLIAEGGLCYKEPANATWVTRDDLDLCWMEPVQNIMNYFAARTPGSVVVETGSTVQWFFQKTQGDHAAIQSKDLLIQLWAGPLLSAPAEVVLGMDCVAVRPTGISKAFVLEKILEKICEGIGEEASQEYLDLFSGESFVLCVSDLLPKDEDMFATLREFFERGNKDSDKTDDGAPKLRSISKRVMQDFIREQDDYLVRSYSEHPGLPPKASSDAGDNTSEKGTSNVGIPKHPAVFTCTVTRKPTRATYHLSDTSDVGFLIAQLARQVKREATKEPSLWLSEQQA